MAAVEFLVMFFGLLAAGMPIFLVLGACAAVLYYVSGQPLIGVAQIIVDQLNSPPLMALPLFVMAASFMRQGGVAKALVDVSMAWLGGIRGSLGLVTVVACTLFAAICGSSVATALAMGTILLPAMVEKGYPRSFALGVVGASGTIGIVIPPSLALILYGIVAEQSVPRLFLAGILPGLLQASLFFAWVWWYARRHDFPREAPLPFADRLRVTARATPALMVPVIVLAGIYGGLVTVTEAAAIAACASLFVSLVFYHGFRWTQTLSVITERAAQRRRDPGDRGDGARLRALDDGIRSAGAAGGMDAGASLRDLAVPARHQRAAADPRLLPGGDGDVAAGAADPGACAGAARRGPSAFLDHLHPQHGDRAGPSAGGIEPVRARDGVAGPGGRGDSRHPAVSGAAADRAGHHYVRAGADDVAAAAGLWELRRRFAELNGKLPDRAAAVRRPAACRRR
jgi:hypothetical protein